MKSSLPSIIVLLSLLPSLGFKPCPAPCALPLTWRTAPSCPPTPRTWTSSCWPAVCQERRPTTCWFVLATWPGRDQPVPFFQPAAPSQDVDPERGAFYPLFLSGAVFRLWPFFFVFCPLPPLRPSLKRSLVENQIEFCRISHRVNKINAGWYKIADNHECISTMGGMVSLIQRTSSGGLLKDPWAGFSFVGGGPPPTRKHWRGPGY